MALRDCLMHYSTRTSAGHQPVTSAQAFLRMLPPHAPSLAGPQCGPGVSCLSPRSCRNSPAALQDSLFVYMLRSERTSLVSRPSSRRPGASRLVSRAVAGGGVPALHSSGSAAIGP